ncbi:TPA: glycosyltransferase family 2 protein, partial [Candidatus Bathyarchaeota archaeon]|nr:glycosyltransferase family 2 protein [Candidatus Bathyarchaeota archaeon]
MNAFEFVYIVFTLLLFAYLARHYVFTIAVLRAARKPKTCDASCFGNFEPSVAILIPAHNEAKVIGRLLERTTQLAYPKDKLQIVVVDDASSDTTGEISDQYANSFPFIKVIHRTEGGKGKSSAMNIGFKNSTGEIVLCLDADYYPQIDMVSKLVRLFADTAVGAVQGRVVVLNEPQNMVTRLVALERIGGYRVDQQAREDLMLIPQFGGTVGGFRRDLLERIGGWDESILAEDTDLTFRIRLGGYRVRYAG